jgi:hypothetical protein
VLLHREKQVPQEVLTKRFVKDVSKNESHRRFDKGVLLHTARLP